MNDQATGVHDAPLTRRELAALREDLEEQRRFRLDQLREFGHPRPGTAQSGTARPESVRPESAQSGAVRAGITATAELAEIDARLAKSARMVLADVEAALERMEQGGYGRCLLCSRPIPARMLEIVPQVRYCAHCRRAEETRR
ncbi:MULTISPECIES: TraR/DksA family transcriptional regulator [Streptomyces]|uniref:Transcriptional regulator, TraR/DksA family n=1 Tax=Streptomyces pini TaxID=1520580 RepID=A0A1I4L879_9ACTN|nr:TraR/DksA C4-type zinc finger protein [Streptomyces pini]SFL87121.1 transcriptional regulator, TraR/DksA family [Streptomyces pini]